jgi:hypothetical protein
MRNRAVLLICAALLELTLVSVLVRARAQREGIKLHLRTAQPIPVTVTLPQRVEFVSATAPECLARC